MRQLAGCLFDAPLGVFIVAAQLFSLSSQLDPGALLFRRSDDTHLAGEHKQVALDGSAYM